MELKPVLPQPFRDNMRVVREGELIYSDPELPADAWQLQSKMAIPVPDCVLARDAWALRLRPEPAAKYRPEQPIDPTSRLRIRKRGRAPSYGQSLTNARGAPFF